MRVGSGFRPRVVEPVSGDGIRASAIKYLFPITLCDGAVRSGFPALGMLDRIPRVNREPSSSQPTACPCSPWVAMSPVPSRSQDLDHATQWPNEDLPSQSAINKKRSAIDYLAHAQSPVTRSLWRFAILPVRTQCSTSEDTQPGGLHLVGTVHGQNVQAHPDEASHPPEDQVKRHSDLRVGPTLSISGGREGPSAACRC